MTKRQNDEKTERQKDRKTKRQKHKMTKRQKEGMTKRQNDKKTGRQTKASLSDKILTKPQLQNLDESLWSKSEQRFKFVTKLQFPNLHQTIINSFFSINIGSSNNLNKF